MDESEQHSQAATAFPLGHKSSHLRTGQLTLAPGVTGPRVFAAARGCFIVARIATPGAVTVGDRVRMSTATDAHAFRRRRGRRRGGPPISRTGRSRWTARAILRL